MGFDNTCKTLLNLYKKQRIALTCISVYCYWDLCFYVLNKNSSRSVLLQVLNKHLIYSPIKTEKCEGRAKVLDLSRVLEQMRGILGPCQPHASLGLPSSSGQGWLGKEYSGFPTVSAQHPWGLSIAAFSRESTLSFHLNACYWVSTSNQINRSVITVLIGKLW